ncbi:tropomyosin-2-like [Gossypium australe]|uniref:Tropomyosin-2-like n=1 Tax=Gossypium australe TaxID=47621 RepID=A0A5B6X5Z6_9ROSI|nr:tropomyosin-2-like [Gossypium australe]
MRSCSDAGVLIGSLCSEFGEPLTIRIKAVYTGNAWSSAMRVLRVNEISTAWNQTLRMKKLTVGSMTTPEYSRWFNRRINDSMKDVRPMEEYLQIVPSELEIIKQDFEKKNRELEKKIEQLEEEKMHLRLDVDV